MGSFAQAQVDESYSGSAMSAWSTRVRRVARDLDIAVEVGSYHGKVQVNVEDLEAIAKALRT